MNNLQTIIEDLKHSYDKNKIQQAAKIIKSGDVVAFPTETVYGLGADALNPHAVKKIFAVKGRPSDNPLILHVSNIKQIYPLVSYFPEEYKQLMTALWPGPLTLLFKKSEKVPTITTGGLNTVAIRIPNNPIALKLIEEAQTPIAAPSANLSGKPSATNAKRVYEDFQGKIPLILDGGKTKIGVESTVLNIVIDPPTILRPGGITYETLKQYLPNITILKSVDPKIRTSPTSPGLKYKHYSPNTRLILVHGDKATQETFINREIIRLDKAKIAVLCLHNEHVHKRAESVILVGEDKKEIQKNLFECLRKLDDEDCTMAYVESVEEEKEGLAIMNRLYKASYEIVYLDS